MHRYLARVIACLAISLAFSLLVVVTPRGGKKEVRVRTDGQTADIVAAVETLKRSDISVKLADDPWVANPVGGVILGTLGMTVILWLASGAVKRIEEWVSTFGPEQKPIQPPQRNAGSRPSSADSPASETPSSLGPRG